MIFCFSAIGSELPCEPWQVLVKKHPVKAHVREGKVAVKKTIRKTHCREKWKNADVWGPILSDSKPLFWPNKEEVFKSWSKIEKETLLDVLSKLPNWLNISVSAFYRAEKSKYQNNPASSLTLTKEIVFYDSFFTLKNQLAVVAHEFSHLLFSSLTDKEKIQFEKLSGWKQMLQEGKLTILSPSKLLQPDSEDSVEEDFSNYIESYIVNPDKVKKFNSNLYDFLKKRFPQ